ncbi:Maltoporin precursor [compost metagenome]
MKTLKVFFVILFWAPFSQAIDADFFGYLRGGTGLNLQGGQQECFFNSGIPGNFLRLGNECGFYSEIGTVFHHKKADETDPVYFKTQVRIVYNSKGTRQWEAAADRDVSQVEAFVTAGGFLGVNSEIWAGKRFYRDVDLYIFDWYYFAEMSGVGAGLENVRLGQGLFSIAHLIQANEDLSTTDVGRPVLQAVDLRWKLIPIFAKQNINLWGVFAWAPKSSDGTDQYQATHGYSLAARLQGPLGTGSNNFSLMYGRGAMKDFNLYANSALPVTDDSQNRAWNIRMVEDWHHEVTDRWAILLGAAAEYGNNGVPEDYNHYWYEVGARPIYFVTDRFQWVFELGYSLINNEAERDGNGDALGGRHLYRVTVAPQLSLGKSIWGRPVLRMFLSYSSWNDENKTFIANTAPTFKDKNSGATFGYQFEAWF